MQETCQPGWGRTLRSAENGWSVRDRRNESCPSKAGGNAETTPARLKRRISEWLMRTHRATARKHIHILVLYGLPGRRHGRSYRAMPGVRHRPSNPEPRAVTRARAERTEILPSPQAPDHGIGKKSDRYGHEFVAFRSKCVMLHAFRAPPHP